jgi:putative endonuclease
MEYFVYIIRSEKTGVFYKGYTSYPALWLDEHNNGQSRYTANKGPWKMVYLEKMPDKRTALIRERQIKRVNPTYINRLIRQGTNIISTVDFSHRENLNSESPV